MEESKKQTSPAEAPEAGMEKRNVVEQRRTPDEEERKSEDAVVKQAQELFNLADEQRVPEKKA